MSSTKKSTGGSALSHVAKSLTIAIFKLLAIAISFICKVIAMALNGISDLLQKASGNGNH